MTVVAKLPRSEITWFHTLERATGKLPVGVLYLYNKKPVTATVSNKRAQPQLSSLGISTVFWVGCKERRWDSVLLASKVRVT